MWGDWQVGHLTAGEYAKKARSWAHALRLVDPSIKLVLCGKEVRDRLVHACKVRLNKTTQGNDDWDREVLQHCVDVVDWHSIHL